MDKSTENFLRILNRQNAAIAAYEAEQEKKQLGEDPIRLQREQERREKWGTLRAREKPSHRPQRSHRLFDYVDPS